MISTLITLLSIFLFFFILRNSFYLIKVDGQSMTPAYDDGDYVLISRLWTKNRLRKGMVVITEIPHTKIKISDSISITSSQNNDFAIKRILGLPGETLTTELTEFHIKIESHYSTNHKNPNKIKVWHIPTGHCFLISDSFGIDSRIWGPIPTKLIKGVVVLKLGNSQT